MTPSARFHGLLPDARQVAGGTIAAVLLLFLIPDPAWAWGPATHVYLSTEILRSLHLLGAPTAALLAAHPEKFVYGSMAPDISLAKKYAEVGRHSHYWHVAWEIWEEAKGRPPLRAAALGYLSHLAADVVAHTSFVPRMLLVTSSTRSVGHSYWEHRMDAGLDADYMATARHLVTNEEHREADRLFSEVKSRTLFSFETNRQIFEGLVQLSYGDGWQSIFDTVVDNSRWGLREEERRRYLSHSFEAVAGFLVNRESADVTAGDPTGEREIPAAKQRRRSVLRAGGWRDPEVLEEAADELFPLPSGETPHWDRRTPAEADAGIRVELGPDREGGDRAGIEPLVRESAGGTSRRRHPTRESA